jgi:hypothetical protein
MDRYGWKGNTFDSGLTNSTIGDYYILYRDTEIKKNRSYAILQQAAGGAIKLSDNQFHQMKNVYSESDELVRKIIKVATECRKDSMKCLPISSFPIIQTKWPKVDPLGAVTQEQTRILCTQASISSEPQLPFTCQQTVDYLVYGKWAEIAGVQVTDSFGQQILPKHGDMLDLEKAFDAAKGKYGPDLNEAAFVSLATGDSGLSSLKEAAAKGWGCRRLSLSFLFGSHSSNTGGLRTTLNFDATSTSGTVSQRQSFMY